MTIPSIGSLNGFNGSGRLGVIVGTQALGQARDGKQMVALQVKTIDGRDVEGNKLPDRATLRVEPPELVPAIAATQVPTTAQQASGTRAQTNAVGTQTALQSGHREPSAARTYDQLSAPEKQAVDQLRQRDAQVRQEENAHAGTAGDLAGPINYTYQRGPDGRSYAVGGSVKISAIVNGGDEAALKRIGSKLAAAANAATNPSAADYAAARKGYALLGAGNSNGSSIGEVSGGEVSGPEQSDFDTAIPGLDITV